MGFPAVSTMSTILRFRCDVVPWQTARASALSAFLGAAHTRLLELLSEPPKDGSALRELEEKMHRAVKRCLDIVTAAALRAAQVSPDVVARVDLLLAANPYLRLQDSKQEVLVTFLGGSSHRISSPYMLRRPPRGRGRPRGRGKRGKPGNGLYPTLRIGNRDVSQETSFLRRNTCKLTIPIVRYLQVDARPQAWRVELTNQTVGSMTLRNPNFLKSESAV
jgi:hypothetical protein